MCDPKTSPCVLIVDDKADIRGTFRAAFTVAGFCVEDARTAGEVIHKINDKCENGDTCFDLILMDIDLPDVRGTTLATWIRQLYPNICLQFVTGFPAPMFTVKAQELGAGITQKPIHNLTGFVEEMRGLIAASRIPGDRRRRGATNSTGMRRRRGDSPIVVSAPLAQHMEAVAQAREVQKN
jgi:DNA-binding response OmpR family regulator